MLENITILEAIGSILGIALTLFFGWLAKRLKASDGEKEAIEALGAGVNQVYLEYVRVLKKGKEDGKLSTEEAKTARQMAVDVAKQTATGPGLKLLLKWGTPRLFSVVQDLVQAKRK